MDTTQDMCNIDWISDDVMQYVFDLLPFNTILIVLLVCKRFHIVGHHELSKRRTEIFHLLVGSVMRGVMRGVMRQPDVYNVSNIEEILHALFGKRSGSRRISTAELKKANGYDNISFILSLHYRHGYMFTCPQSWCDLLSIWKLNLEHPTLIRGGIRNFVRDKTNLLFVSFTQEDEIIEFGAALKENLNPPERFLKKIYKFSEYRIKLLRTERDPSEGLIRKRNLD